MGWQELSLTWEENMETVIRSSNVEGLTPEKVLGLKLYADTFQLKIDLSTFDMGLFLAHLRSARKSIEHWDKISLPTV